MGVQDLWLVLETAGSECSLKDLKGLKLAVDMSVWVYQGKVDNKQLHLRSTFHRVRSMIRGQIQPVFVREGPSHPLKQETRGQASDHASYRHVSSFENHTQSCCQLLEALGVPVIESAAEGEATCAALNHLGLVNGVITEDSDAFLFGATVVYRHFSCDTRKEGKMKCYRMKDIKEKLKLDRRRLVAYALLVGCDFTKGVPGVGMVAAVKLLDSLLEESDILKRFQTWKTDDFLRSLETHRNVKKPKHCRICAHDGSRMAHKADGCEQCKLPNSCMKASCISCSCDWHKKTRESESHCIELNIYTKAMNVRRFPNQRVIDAFLQPSELQKLTAKDRTLLWHRPDLAAVKRVIGWSPDKATNWVHDVLEMVTAFDMAEILAKIDGAMVRIQPECVQKLKVEKGTKHVVVKWCFVAGFTELPESDLVTTEDSELFEKCFPHVYQTFLEERKEKTSEANMKRKRKVKDLGKSQLQIGQSSITDHFKVTKKETDN